MNFIEESRSQMKYQRFQVLLCYTRSWTDHYLRIAGHTIIADPPIVRVAPTRLRVHGSACNSIITKRYIITILFYSSQATKSKYQLRYLRLSECQLFQERKTRSQVSVRWSEREIWRRSFIVADKCQTRSHQGQGQGQGQGDVNLFADGNLIFVQTSSAWQRLFYTTGNDLNNQQKAPMNHSKYDKKYVCAASIIKLLDDCALRVSDDSILCVRVSTSRALITNSTHRKKKKVE